MGHEGHEGYVTVRFEACTAFVVGDAAAGACGDCGWLAEDHERAAAVVHRLPSTRRIGRRQPTPKRKAS